MADDPKTGGFANSSALVVALFSVVALAFNHLAPLQVARPGGEETQFHQSASAQDVDARLWQDPFTVVAKAEADRRRPLNCKEKNDTHCRTPIVQLRDAGSLDGVDRLFVLAVTVSGAPYAEDEENRRRTHYAVVSGLNRMGFEPDDAEHIGFFQKDAISTRPEEPRLPIGPIADVKTQERSPGIWPITIPFELFAEKTPSKRSAMALVLWVDEGKLRKSPLMKLSQILSFVACPRDFNSCPKITPQIIGPKESDILRDMVREAPKGYSYSDWPNLVGVQFYAYGATVPDSIVLGDAEHETISKYLQTNANLHLLRTIATDDVLASAIRQELQLRGVNPRVDQHIVLISEWDTLYGRTAAATFERAFIESDEKKGKDSRNWIFERTYLHGLDGALPQSGKDVKKTDATSKPDKDKSDEDGRALDRPYGQGQDDYLRRLADDLKTQDVETGRQIKAIGVIGGDVFDKLRVLRALKPEFPEALFFTTDFDAAFKMQSELKFTRNLLIASSFGPQLRPERQCHIPPFRDVYETSAFLATQIALTDSGRPAPCPAPDRGAVPPAQIVSQADPPAVNGAQLTSDLVPGEPHAAIFEIARTGDVLALPSGNERARDALSENKRRDWDETCSSDLSKCGGGVQSDDTPLYPQAHLWLLVPAIGFSLFAGIAGLVIGARYRNAVDAKKVGSLIWLYRLYWPIALGLLGAALFGVCYIWPSSADWITERARGEPMRLALGVSVWPAILLRVATFLLSIWLICVSFVKLRKNLDEISDKTNLEHPAKIRPEKTEAEHWLKGIWDGLVAFISNIYNLPARKNDDYPIARAWPNYVNQSRVGPTVVRTLLYFALMFLLLNILFVEFGHPLNPARGPWTHPLYQALTYVDVGLMWFLVFLVVDATLFCFLFVRQLSRGHSMWATKTTELFAEKLGLDPSSLPFDQKMLNDWIDLFFIGQRTRCINSLIWYPFAVTALMIVSRSSIFANFPPSAPIMITQGVSLAIVFGCAFLLNGVAEDARALAAKGLSDEIDKAKGQPGAPKAPLLEHMLERVQTMHEGSFRPFLKQPAIGAILLPIGSIGWTTLFEQAQLFGL